MEGTLALRKVYFVAQASLNYAEMSVFSPVILSVALCFHTYPRIDLHF